MCSSHSIFEIKTWLKNEFKNDVDLDLEYFEISNPTTLQATTNWSECDRHIACIAVFAGEIRLIDNIMLEIN